MTGARRSVAVFDRHWRTAGGGETYAAGIAAVLCSDHDVTLLSHEEVDLGWLGERLRLDLSCVQLRVIDECSSFADITSEYDVFLNVSFGSRAANGAAKGVYVVHFPGDPDAGLSAWQRAIRGTLAAPAVRSRRAIECRSGFHDPAIARTWRVRWTDGDGVLRLAPSPRARTLHVAMGRFIPGGVDRDVIAEIDGREVARARITRPPQRWRALTPVTMQVPVPASDAPVIVHLRSATSTPHEVLDNGDHRRLGIPVLDLRFGRGPSLFPLLSITTTSDDVGEWLDTYDSIISNSAFTAQWVAELWNRSSLVIEPPVTMRTSGPKEPMILSVGRFFGEDRGHSKKQLEMVRAFGRLGAVARGWTLHLVGGCSPDDSEYLESVRHASAGLDVVFHVDAPGVELDDLYSRASVYWHATGLGDEVATHPERAEHFGITTVEAMSAGAVPIVFAAGGQPEIVRDGVDGFVFDAVEGLLEHTRTVLADDALRARLSASASERARRFGTERFAERFRSLVSGV